MSSGADKIPCEAEVFDGVGAPKLWEGGDRWKVSGAVEEFEGGVG